MFNKLAMLAFMAVCVGCNSSSPATTTAPPRATPSATATAAYQQPYQPVNSLPTANQNGQVLTFASISSIVTQNCGGGGCHSAGGYLTVFDGNQANFDAQKSQIYSQISSGSMPRGRSMSANDRQTLLNYCSH